MHFRIKGGAMNPGEMKAAFAPMEAHMQQMQVAGEVDRVQIHVRQENCGERRRRRHHQRHQTRTSEGQSAQEVLEHPVDEQLSANGVGP